MKINCIVIDDEPLARKGLAEYIADVDFLELKGQGESALVANNLLSEHKIDLMFLDIQMPKMTGVELVKTLQQKPMIIFTTAFSDYAVQSYELDVLDYLIKPISFERFLKACNKAREFYSLKNEKTTTSLKTDEYFFVKGDAGYEKIQYNDILYIEAMENYVVIHTNSKKITSYLTFKSVEDYLPSNRFLKVHKSFIIALDKVNSIAGDEIMIGNNSIPVGRTIKDDVMKAITSNKLLKR